MKGETARIGPGRTAGQLIRSACLAVHRGQQGLKVFAARAAGVQVRRDARVLPLRVVLFYRGSWCPYCNAQLTAFQHALDRLAELDVMVVALSVDDEATTRDLIARHGLRFPVGHSADAAAIAQATGAFVNPDPVYLQSTGFVLDQDGRVVVSVYSSGAIGRLVPQDVIG